jgi:hypothetical protein
MLIPENRRYVADDLINEQAQIAVYDPKVTAKKSFG